MHVREVEAKAGAQSNLQEMWHNFLYDLGFI